MAEQATQQVGGPVSIGPVTISSTPSTPLTITEAEFWTKIDDPTAGWDLYPGLRSALIGAVTAVRDVQIPYLNSLVMATFLIDWQNWKNDYLNGRKPLASMPVVPNGFVLGFCQDTTNPLAITPYPVPGKVPAGVAPPTPDPPATVSAHPIANPAAAETRDVPPGDVIPIGKTIVDEAGNKWVKTRSESPFGVRVYYLKV